jgi:hypothetical protein
MRRLIGIIREPPFCKEHKIDAAEDCATIRTLSGIGGTGASISRCRGYCFDWSGFFFCPHRL